MTIPSTPRRAGPFTGNGAQTEFPFGFKVFGADDLDVRLYHPDTGEQVLTAGSYTVELNENQDTSPGGIVTYPADVDALPISTVQTLAIVGGLEYDQPLDLPGGGNFNPTAVENELDRIVMQIQQVAEVQGRTITLPATSTLASVELPNPEADKYIGWNALGTGLTNLDAPAGTGDAFAWRYQAFEGNGVTTAFTLADSPASLADTTVTVDGLTLVPVADYDLSGGNLLTFVTAPTFSTEILVRYGVASITNPLPRAVYRFTALGGQTTVTLPAAYPQGVNALAVYVNGLRMENGGLDFTETTSTTLTFTSPLVSGDSVVCIVGTEAMGADMAVTWAGISGKPSTFTPSTHSHAITDITGLQTALDSKQATLVSGTNIKTVNGTSLLGSGNLAVSGSGTVDAAAIAAALTADATTKDWIWNSAIPGAVNAGDATSIYIQRNANYTGGTFAQVRSALYLETFTPTGTHNPFEWGLTSVVHSRSVVSGGGESAAPQNVGMNGTIFRTAGNAPIWAGNFAAYHLTDQYTSADGPMHGLEVNVGGNGTDEGESTIGIYVVPQLRAEVAGPGAFEGWTGILVTGGGGSSARWRNGITNQAGSVFGYFDRGTHQVAIDLSQSTNAESAIRIKANDWIALEATNAIKFKYNSSNGYLEFFNGSNRRGYINMSTGADADLAAGGGGTPSNMVTTDTTQTITGYKAFTGGVEANGLIMNGYIALGSVASIQWHGAMTSITAGSGFASLPANPVGFVKIAIDGTERKIPYYV